MMGKGIVVTFVAWFVFWSFAALFVGTVALLDHGLWSVFAFGAVMCMGGLWVAGYVWHEETRRW